MHKQYHSAAICKAAVSSLRKAFSPCSEKIVLTEHPAISAIRSSRSIKSNESRVGQQCARYTFAASHETCEKNSGHDVCLDAGRLYGTPTVMIRNYKGIKCWFRSVDMVCFRQDLIRIRPRLTLDARSDSIGNKALHRRDLATA